ncbi:hypothetical protein [Bythopirellula goksoeyrii]|uniref:PEP-CTERM protein-sorting domain-containing protein n=1 Tax=Bythopirellula goksoeyrii TaxID=1400387 RepID=A0A5B9QAK4_9BACT|nr:hypothetical protein [Bythopirellula goksoeyrii]QEG36017.1 hypothetical protein Pr1d_33260 [Bythopirellula goksoeyrii]
MRNFLLGIVIVLFAVVPAHASLEIVGGAGATAVPGGNDFMADLAALTPSLDMIFNSGADIKVNGAGTVYFYYHGAESGYTNEFVTGGTWTAATFTLAGGTSLETEADESWSFPGSAIGSIAVSDGDLFSSLGIGFRVKTAGSGTPKDALAGTAGFGVFYNDGLGSAGDGTYSQVFYGFDDNGASVDDNHDDMMVSAVFVPVPEPLSVAVWSGLAVAFSVVSVLSKRRQGSNC